MCVLTCDMGNAKEIGVFALVIGTPMALFASLKIFAIRSSAPFCPKGKPGGGPRSSANESIKGNFSEMILIFDYLSVSLLNISFTILPIKFCMFLKFKI